MSFYIYIIYYAFEFAHLCLLLNYFKRFKIVQRYWFCMRLMLIIAAKLVGTGLTSIRVIGAGIGIELVFAGYMIALSKNPSLKNKLFSIIILRFALSEATALFALMIAFLLLFTF